MAHVSFMSIPAHGHVNPSLSLVAELVRRGHRVTYATSYDFHELVASVGAEVKSYPSTFPADMARLAKEPDDLVAAQQMIHDEFIEATPRIEAAYAGDIPDVIIYDIGALQGPVLGAKWGIPAIQLAPTFVGYEGMAEDFGIDPEASLAMMAQAQEFETFVASMGVELDRMQVLFAPTRCIVTIPRFWQLKGGEMTDRFTFVGPSVDTRMGEWDAPDERPVLLISLGSAFTKQLDFYRECVRAFADSDWYVLLSVGQHVDPEDLGELPSNVEVVRWMPQVSVLAKASAFVTHGGMGSTMEALYFGVPMVAVPQGVDQHLNGARIAELGLGEHVPLTEATADRLREAVQHVTSSEEIAARLVQVREDVRACGGAVEAADIVESFV